MSTGDVYVRVLYDFLYNTEDGREVRMKEGEELLVIKKSNNDWWQVIRNSEKFPFYAPSGYLEIIGVPLCTKLKENPKDENANINSSLNEIVAEHAQKKYCVSDASIVDNIPTSQENTPNATFNSSNISSLSFQNPLFSVNSDSVNQNETQSRSQCSSFKTVPSIERSQSASNLKEKNASYQDSSLPIYANIPLITTVSPSKPKPDDIPHRQLSNNWFEYIDDNGRKFYYNVSSGKVTWKPPRRSETVSDGNCTNSDNVEKATLTVPKPPPKQLKPKLKKLAHSSTESLDSSPPSMFTILPSGWTQECDIESGVVYYFNETTKKKWYSSQDENGRTYFYDEDSSESLWELPDALHSDAEICKSEESLLSGETSLDSPLSSLSSSTKNVKDASSLTGSPKLQHAKAPKLPFPRQFKARSMVITDSVSISNLEDEKNASSYSLGCIIYEGLLSKTKLVEGGRRVRKNWATSYVVLTDVFLLFHKDQRSAHTVPVVKPEFSIDLNGALIDWCPEKSSKKNVFQISTILGHQLLLHHEDIQEVKEWFISIHDVILKLASVREYGNRLDEKDDAKTEIKLSRSKSTKPICSMERHYVKDNNEDANLAAIPAEKRRKIRDKLRHFFVRRPTMESLREKGIIMDEPVFGCLLENLCLREGQLVPKFVTRCIETIEIKELTADGLYRASGNLSQVQKIRFHVNQDDYKCIDEEEDVHVLTGALKMFFREMKEPLFPFQMFNKFLNAIALPDAQGKLKALKELVHKMPEPNFETMKFLLQHLLKVTEYHKQNRMQVQNLAIVFGPTLMWPEEESLNIALDMMHQNRIVEFLLLEYRAIFQL